MQISPVTRSKNDARTAYNRMSCIYDLLAGSSETPLMHVGLDLLAVREAESVLEIGCGTGKGLVEITKKVGSKGQVHGIDLSSGMLRQAHERLAKADLLHQIPLVEGDGAWLPYQNASFSAVFLSFTLELFDTPEIAIVLVECRRVLVSGGRLGVVSMLKTTNPGWIVRLYEWLHAHLPSYVDCRPIETHTLIQAAGFRIENLQTKSMWGLPVEVVLAKK
jgi:demethylmenaquinone methyltransferase/2-methoxy-6-polyprenyl-1,4-benzoquinol methylase